MCLVGRNVSGCGHESRYFPGDSLDNYRYTEIRIAGFGVKI
jgi:hypothetical protein